MPSTDAAAEFTRQFGGPAPCPPDRTRFARECDYLAAIQGYLSQEFKDHILPSREFLERTLFFYDRGGLAG